MNALPICDVCGRPVERMVTVRDDLESRTMFKVYCHGQEDSGWLSDADVYRALWIDARAFRRKRLDFSARTASLNAQ